MEGSLRAIAARMHNGVVGFLGNGSGVSVGEDGGGWALRKGKLLLALRRV